MGKANLSSLKLFFNFSLKNCKMQWFKKHPSQAVFKAILIIVSGNIHFSSAVNPAIIYTWILQIRLMLASWQLLHTTHPLSFLKTLSQKQPTSSLLSHSEYPLTQIPSTPPSSRQHSSKTTKSSGRGIPSSNFLSCSYPKTPAIFLCQVDGAVPIPMGCGY